MAPEPTEVDPEILVLLTRVYLREELGVGVLHELIKDTWMGTVPTEDGTAVYVVTTRGTHTQLAINALNERLTLVRKPWGRCVQLELRTETEDPGRVFLEASSREEIWPVGSVVERIRSSSKLPRHLKAWLPGDDSLHELDNALAMARWIGSELCAGLYTQLGAGGGDEKRRTALARVFTDLRVDHDGGKYRPSASTFGDLALSWAAYPGDQAQPGLSGSRDRSEAHHPRRLVLVGGPGQGKSTLAAWLCQLHRAALVPSLGPAGLPEGAQEAALDFKPSAEKVRVKRLPLRVVLYRYAAALYRGEVGGLLDWLVQEANRATGREEISGELLRGWLTAWPSLLVLDGLDEVPASANRDQVLHTARAFLSELEQGGADVFVVATTRPQGYRGEWSVEDWEHLPIAELNSTEALDYARKLLGCWLSGDLVRQGELLARVQRAVEDPTTARLTRSPLQVTILTLLAEQMGAPPRERWRLFREYYRLIYQRERERGIPAVEILAQQPALVDRLHTEVGFLLQRAAERAAGAGASYDQPKLRELIDRLLAEDGYEGSAKEERANQLVEASLDRLVFLVPVGDGVGFEIRSLQEYFAAERLFLGDEALLPRRLAALAPSAFWRNVLLFAVGRLVVDRPHLLREVDPLCAGLDAGPLPLRRGAALALDLLADGALDTRPAARLPLLRRVLDGLGAVDDPTAVVQALGQSAPKELQAALERPMRANEAWAWAIAWRWAAAGSEEGRAVVLACAGAEAAGEALAGLLPNEWSAALAQSFEAFPEPLSANGLSKYLDYLLSRQDMSEGVVSLHLADPTDPAASGSTAYAGAVEFRLVWPVHEFSRLLHIPKSLTRRYPALNALLCFLRLPNAAGLAEAILTSKGTDDAYLRSLSDYAPWPLAAVWTSPQTLWEGLAAEAKAGRLGDHEDWVAAEERWRKRGVLVDELLYAARVPSPDLSDQGAPPFVRLVVLFIHAVEVLAARGADLGALATKPHLWHWSAAGAKEPLPPSPVLLSWVLAQAHQASIDFGGLLGKAVLKTDQDDWLNVLVRTCDTLVSLARWPAPRLTSSEAPAVEALVPHLSRHPSLWWLLPPLLAEGAKPAASLPPAPSEPKLAACAMLVEAATVVDSEAAALARRLVQVDAGLLPVWPMLINLLDHQRPPGAIELLRELLSAGAEVPRLDLQVALISQLEHLPSSLHRPSTAQALDLPLPEMDEQPSRVAPTAAAMPIHLKRVLLSDLRGWQALELKPPTPDPERGQWIFVVGENGTGKTTLLRGLALALVEPAAGQRLHSGMPGRMLREGAEQGSVLLELADGRSFTAAFRGSHVQGTLPASSRDFFSVGYGPRRGTLLGGANREPDYKPGEEMETLFQEGGSLIHGVSWLKSLRLRSYERSQDQVLFARVLEALKSVLPGVDDIEVSADEVRVTGPAVGRVPLEALSDGYLTTAGFLIDLLARWLERERQAKRIPGPDFLAEVTGLALIDEVDLNLHPRWQWSFVEDLRRLFPRLSFVVTTHNPVTLLGAQPGEIWVVERTETGSLRAVQRDIPPGTDVGRVLTGDVFGLPSAVDRGTANLLDEHRELLRKQPDAPRIAELESELRQRLGGFGETSLERIAASAVAQELQERADRLTAAQRAAARERAREVLRRMRENNP